MANFFDQLLVHEALTHINKFKDYTKLIELFELNPLAIIDNENAYKVIVGLAKGELGKGRGRRDTPKNESIRRYLVDRVYAYHFWGFSLYSSENDLTKINAKEVPTSSTGKVFLWCNEQKNIPHITYETLRKHVRKDKDTNQNKFSFSLLSHLIDVYKEEGEHIDISKAKLNAKGTSFDVDIFPEFWKELDRG